MIDFPIMPDVASKSSWILSGFMYFCILAGYRSWATCPPANPNHYSRKNWFVFLVFIYCLFAFYCGDWAHLQTIVKESVGSEYREGFGVEEIYHYLANILNGNYLIFRSIVWGAGLLCMVEAFKKSKLDPYRCLYFLFGIYITAFAYSRAGVALAFFYCGFVFLFKDREERSVKITLLGLALLITSTFLHRSMLVLVALTPMVLIPIKKKTSLLIFAGVIVLAFMWNSLFSGVMGNLMNSEEYMHRIELYEGMSGSAAFSFDLNGFFFLWYKAIVHLPFWYCIINIYRLVNKGEVPFNIETIFRFSILLYIFAIMMLLMYGSASAFYYRYEGMLYIPISIMANYLFQNNHIKARTYSNVFWICALSQCKDFIYRIIFW